MSIEIDSICFGVKDSVVVDSNSTTLLLDNQILIHNVNLAQSTTLVFNTTSTVSNFSCIYFLRVYVPSGGKTLTFPSGIKWFVAPPSISGNTVSLNNAHKYYYFRIEDCNFFGKFGYYIGCADK